MAGEAGAAVNETTAAAKKVRVKVRVRDELIQVQKAHPPFRRPRPPPDDFLVLLTPEDREDLLATFAKDAAIDDKWCDEEIRILSEYTQSGCALEVVEVDESVLEQYHKKGVSYEVVDR